MHFPETCSPVHSATLNFIKITPITMCLYRNELIPPQPQFHSLETPRKTTRPSFFVFPPQLLTRAGAWQARGAPETNLPGLAMARAQCGNCHLLPTRSWDQKWSWDPCSGNTAVVGQGMGSAPGRLSSAMGAQPKARGFSVRIFMVKNIFQIIHSLIHSLILMSFETDSKQERYLLSACSLPK